MRNFADAEGSFESVAAATSLRISAAGSDARISPQLRLERAIVLRVLAQDDKRKRADGGQ